MSKGKIMSDIDKIKASFKKEHDQTNLRYVIGREDLSAEVEIADEVLDNLSEALSQSIGESIFVEEPVTIKKKRGRPKGSTKKVNRKAVASQKLTISLSQEEKEQIQQAAEKEQRTVSDFIKFMLRKHKVLKKAKSKY